MTIRRNRLPALNARSFVLEQLLCVHSVNADLRWAMVELAVQSLAAICVFAQAKLVVLIRRMVRRENRRGAHGIAAADTMVAAGGR
jgi:hypothetical protein